MDLIPLTHDDLPALKSLDAKALQRIERGMAEHNRAIQAFGRKNSQTTARLMSLTMLSEGPLRQLRQCLAEIDRRKQALFEASFALRKKRIDLRWKRRRLDELETAGEASQERELLEVEIDELRYQLAETARHAEGALKDIAGLQDAYTEIREAHGIPVDWDETHFEAAETRAHVLSAFRLAFSDILERGSLSRSAIEYLGQFGIHPFTAQTYCRDYLAELKSLREKQQKLPEISHFYAWLDRIADHFGEEYQKAMARIGLTSLVSEWCQYRETLSR